MKSAHDFTTVYVQGHRHEAKLSGFVIITVLTQILPHLLIRLKTHTEIFQATR